MWGKGKKFACPALIRANWSGWSRSDLEIKYLQDFWGSLLDMTTTVGETFIDRACGVDISNSIVKVVRFPPTSSELENPFRCASIAPESSARPRKRGFEQFAERDQTELQDDVYANTFDPEQLISSQRVSKRQRKSLFDMHDVTNYLRPIQSGEVLGNVAPQDSSQTAILQRSTCIQVNDSQRSPGHKRTASVQNLAGNWLIHAGRNPYGTPPSFSLQSPQRLVSFNHHGNLAIPESPPSKKTSLTENAVLLTSERERGHARSESLELDASVHEIYKADNPSIAFEKKGNEDERSKTSNNDASAISKSPSLPSYPIKIKATESKLQEKVHDQAAIAENGVLSSKPRFRLPNRGESNERSATISKARDIFDPIDTEAEKSQELQNSRRVKRLKGSTSLPGKSPDGPQSPGENYHPGNPTFPRALQAQKKLPVDLDLPGADEQNRPSSSTNTLGQGLSPAKAVQEVINGSAKRPPRQFGPQNLLLELGNQAEAGSEDGSIINEQIRSPLPAPLKRDIQIVHRMQEASSTLQAERSEAPNLAATTRKVSLQDRTGKGKEANGFGDIEEASIHSPMSHKAREKQADEPTAEVALKDSKPPDDSSNGRKSESMNLKKESSVAQPVDQKSEDEKLADGVIRENARRKEVLRGYGVDLDPAKPFKTQPAVAGRSGSSTAKGISKKLEPRNPVTPKPGTSSGNQSHSPVTSNPRTDPRSRKSMTPAFPGPALSKQIVAGAKSSKRTPSQQLTNEDSLLHSDTKRMSNTLSRPTGFPKDQSILSSTQELASGNRAETERKGKISGIGNERSRDSAKIKKEPKSASLMDTSKSATEKTPKQVKTQTKLNIIRDVKGKGRLDDPPVRSQAESQEPIILSSEDENSASSFYSDDEIHLGRSKAGPSKRKRTAHAHISNEKTSVQKPSPSSLGVPASKSATMTEKQASLVGEPATNSRKKSSKGSEVQIASELTTAITPKTNESRPDKAAKNSVKGGTNPRPQAIKEENIVGEAALSASSIAGQKVDKARLASRNLSPRAPAQYMTKPVSISSGSDSDTDSEDDSNVDSESDSESEAGKNADAQRSLPTQVNSDERSDRASQQKPSRKTNMGLTAQENRTAQRHDPLIANSISVANIAVSEISNVNLGSEADEQLQRECHQSVGPNSKRASSTVSEPTSDEESNLSHPRHTNDGGVESNRRPSNYPYPSMTELKEKRSEKLRSQHLTNGSVAKPTLDNLDPKLFGNSSDSSSNSENDSESEQSTDGARLNSAKSKPDSFKTVKRILKGRF